jgi:hypothetical protein
MECEDTPPAVPEQIPVSPRRAVRRADDHAEGTRPLASSHPV